EREVQFAEIAGEDESRFDAKAVSASIVAFHVEFAGDGDVHRVRALFRKAIARLEPGGVEQHSCASSLIIVARASTIQCSVRPYSAARWWRMKSVWVSRCQPKSNQYSGSNSWRSRVW